MQEQLLAANLDLTVYLQGLGRVVDVSKTITSNLLLRDILNTVLDAAVSVSAGGYGHHFAAW